MKLDPAGADRNRRLIEAEMGRLGIERGSLANIDAFLAEYTVAIAAEGFAISEIVLDASAGAPLCRYDLNGLVWLNLARFTEIVGREHRYPLLVMAHLSTINPHLRLSVNWDACDAFLLRRAHVAEISDIHWIFLHFLYHHQRLSGRGIHTMCGFATMQIGGPPTLFARPGVVELRALRAVLEYDGALGGITRDIAARQHDDAFMFGPWNSNDADAADPHWAIRMLMTNAGMYGDAHTLESALRDWAGRYLDGLRASHELFNWWDYSLHNHIVRLLAEQRGLAYARLAPKLFPSTEEFYQQLAGRRVLFVTAYARAVDHVLATNTIARIWKSVIPPPLAVTTVQAFVSTYPNAPHSAWSESFAALAARVDMALAGGGYDLVIAACGCYGIPLLHHCLTHHGLTGIYFGNKMNMWFGIKQNAFASDYGGANLEHWADPFLGWDGPIPTNIARIDDGRYVDTRGG